jgi:hypothetical protein
MGKMAMLVRERQLTQPQNLLQTGFTIPRHCNVRILRQSLEVWNKRLRGTLVETHCT